MLEILVFALIAIVGAQALVIKALIGAMKEAKQEIRAERKATKHLIKELVSIASEYRKDVEEYKEAYESCYSEFKVLFKENKMLKDRLEYVENLHSHMVNNLHVLLKQGRIIKSKYMNKVVPYANFGQLSEADRLELFGA